MMDEHAGNSDGRSDGRADGRSVGPRTIMPDSRKSPRFAGLCTFARYPRLEDVLGPSSPPDWVIYGAPYDTGVTFRPGARFGPRAIRDASQYVKRYHMPYNVDVCEVLSLADAGDSPVLPFDLRGSMDEICNFAVELAEPQTRLLALGGDHSVAYANIRATHARLCAQGMEPAGGLAVIHFDSHLDTVDTVWGEKWSHASPFRRGIEEGLIDPRTMLSIGIKGPLNTRDDLAYATQQGMTVVTREMLSGPSSAGGVAISSFVRALGSRSVYMTFDIDVVDPAFAPGTGTPSIGGLSSTEALALLRLCRGVNIVGGDVVEVLPDRDISQITALLAGHIGFEMLALAADYKQAH